MLASLLITCKFIIFASVCNKKLSQYVQNKFYIVELSKFNRVHSLIFYKSFVLQRNTLKGSSPIIQLIHAEVTNFILKLQLSLLDYMRKQKLSSKDLLCFLTFYDFYRKVKTCYTARTMKFSMTKSAVSFMEKFIFCSVLYSSFKLISPML